MASDLFTLTIAEARERLARREISAVELTQACLDRAAATESRLNAFITLSAREAMAQAEIADQRISDGSASALTGIPLAIKDIFLQLAGCGRPVRRRFSNASFRPTTLR